MGAWLGLGGTVSSLQGDIHWVRLKREQKKVQTMRERLDRLGNELSEDEKILFARSLAATPDERWQMHENFLRSLNLYTRSARKAYGFK
jgi:hypothetical protein